MEEPGAAAPGPSRTVWIVVAVIVVAIVVIVAVLAAAGILLPTAGPQTAKIGTILPVTGPLSDFGPRMQNAAELARSEINDAGGVLGMDLELIHEDSQTRPAQGSNAAAKLIFTDGVPAIVGAASSGVSQAVSQITLENEIVQISPASTSPLFTTFEIERHASLVAQGLIPEDTPVPDTADGIPGWFWRTAPSDALQGKVAAMIANGEIEGIDGFSTIGIIAVNNPYGKGFAGAFRDTYTGTVVAQVNYTEEQPDYTSELQIIQNAGPPDAVLLIGYPEDALTMFTNYEGQGFTWAWQWSEGLKSTEFLSDLDGQGIETDGILGTSPLPPAGAAFNNFQQRMQDRFELDLFPFDAHTYDAVMLIALAMEAGGGTDSDTIRTTLNAVSSPPGTKVFPGEFAKAKQLIAEGADIDYEGASGSVNFDATGEVGSDYEVFEVQSDAFQQVTVVPQTELFAPPLQQIVAVSGFLTDLAAAGRA